MGDRSDNALLTAALAYAARGWPVLPCSPADKRPLVAADRDGDGKAVRGTGGLSKASTDAETIRAWWTRWPKAMIGVAQGDNRAFALDFDPRHDETTGEVFTLERLKADVEAQIGVALPLSATAITPSGGVHVYLQQPGDSGVPVRNRGNLPRHVDVRGAGGYTIVPPSAREDGRIYRWLRDIDATPLAPPPAELVAVLRSRGGAEAVDPPAPRPSGGRHAPPYGAVTKYAMTALEAETRAIASAGSGTRNEQLNASAFAIGTLVGAGALSEFFALAALRDAAASNAGRDDAAQIEATIQSGFRAGVEQPRDLSDVAQHAGKPARVRGGRMAAGQTPARAASAGDRPPPDRPSAPAPPPDPDSGPADPPAPSSTDEGKPCSHEGFDSEADAACMRFAMTDLGNSERFLHRCGETFRYCEEHGWLLWVGTHWRVLSDDMSDKRAPPAEVMIAVYRVIRAIAAEADELAAAGIAWRDDEGLAQYLPAEATSVRCFEFDPDPVVDVVKSRLVRQSDKLRKWGSASESAQHLAAVAKLAKPHLTVAAELFDSNPLKVNVQNGTLSFAEIGDGCLDWWAELRPHDRLDYITKVSPARYDPAATCPRYDALLAWAQPDDATRRFIHAWGGLSLTAIPVQLLVQHYGTGGNGKGTIIEAQAYAAGDYAASIGIETILNTGQQRDPTKASPDLAKLPGVRMLRATEPNEGARLDEALVKRLTGGDPIDARHLNRGFFTYKPVFKLTVQGNYRLRITGTDNGIWRRVRLVAWKMQIADADKDEELPKKLEAEADGILLRLVEGLLDYLANGLIESDDIKAATAEYRADSDPLGRFLEDATMARADEEIGATPLHAAYAAWAKLNGESDWSLKHLNKKMKERGFETKKASTMFWLGLRLVKSATFYEDDPEFPSGPAQREER